jgi:hypothetical protein
MIIQYIHDVEVIGKTTTKQNPQTVFNLVLNCRDLGIFYFHMFSNGGQGTLPKIGQP